MQIDVLYDAIILNSPDSDLERMIGKALNVAELICSEHANVILGALILCLKASLSGDLDALKELRTDEEIEFLAEAAC